MGANTTPFSQAGEQTATVHCSGRQAHVCSTRLCWHKKTWSLCLAMSRGGHSQLSVPLPLPCCSSSPSTPTPHHPTSWLRMRKNLLWGLSNNDERLPPLYEICLCIPEGAFITPHPGCRHHPPSDPPVQKGSLVRHMKPAPPDIWTQLSPLAEHEAALNTTDRERRALVLGPNGPTKWMQLGVAGAEGEEGNWALLAATPGTSIGQSERQVCFPAEDQGAPSVPPFCSGSSKGNQGLLSAQYLLCQKQNLSFLWTTSFTKGFEPPGHQPSPSSLLCDILWPSFEGPISRVQKPDTMIGHLTLAWPIRALFRTFLPEIRTLCSYKGGSHLAHHVA